MIEIRAVSTREELKQAFVIRHYFGAEVTDEVADRFEPLLGDRMLAAWDGDEVVGGAARSRSSCRFPAAGACARGASRSSGSSRRTGGGGS